MQNRQNITTTLGFTLVEMLVAVAIFSVVAVVGLTALLNIKAIQAKTTTLRTINNNINFAIELMSREIRTGKGFCAGGGCSSSTFRFTNDDGEAIEYSLNDGRVTRRVGGGEALLITASEVNVTKLQFAVNGAASSDGLQPRVTIIINAITTSEKSNLNSSINVQTTISQREIDS